MPNYFSKKKYPSYQAITDGFFADQDRWFSRAQLAAPNLPQDKSDLLRCAFGFDSSTNELLGSNGVERAEIMQRLATAMIDHTKATNHTIARVTINNADWKTSRQNPTIDLVSIRLATTLLKKLGHSSIATIRIGCLPSGTSATRHRFHTVVDAIVFDDDVASTVPVAAVSLQRRYLAPPHVSSPITIAYHADARVRTH